MRIVKNTLIIIFSLLFIIAGINLIFGIHAYTLGILFVSIGILIAPPTFNYFERQLALEISTPIRVLIIFGLIVFGLPIASKLDENTILDPPKNSTETITNKLISEPKEPIKLYKFKWDSVEAQRDSLIQAGGTLEDAIRLFPHESDKVKSKTSKKPANSKPAVETLKKEQKKRAKPRNKDSRSSSYCYYNGWRLYQGRRGGCYYLNRNGNKAYVDRGYCRCR